MELYLKPCYECQGVVSIKKYSDSDDWVIQCKNYSCAIKPRMIGSDLGILIKKWNRLNIKGV